MAAPKGNKYAVGKATGRPEYWTPERIQVEADALLEWSKKPDSLILREFAYERDYHESVFATLEEKSEVFSQAKRVAKGRIGARRERGALNGTLAEKVVLKSWAIYDDEMRAYEKELKEDATSMAQQQMQRVASALMNRSRDPTDMQNNARPRGRPPKQSGK